MQIDDEQCNLLQEMSPKLEKLGISLGILTPNGAFIPEEAEFILRLPNGEFEVPMLLHKDDIHFRHEGNMMVHEPVDDPKHDDEVQALFKTINDAILDGEIYFDPRIVREIEGVGQITIVQRDLTHHPRIGEYLYELPLYTSKGNLWTYGRIHDLAERGEPRFNLVRDLIDEAWPEEKERFFRGEVAEAVDRGDYDEKNIKPPVKPTTAYMPSKLLRSFRKWLGMG